MNNIYKRGKLCEYLKPPYSRFLESLTTSRNMAVITVILTPVSAIWLTVFTTKLPILDKNPLAVEENSRGGEGGEKQITSFYRKMQVPCAQREIIESGKLLEYPRGNEILLNITVK